MNFKEFLLEAPNHVEKYSAKTLPDLAEALKKRFKVTEAISQINAGNVLYRGMGEKAQALGYFNMGFAKGNFKDVRPASSINGNNFHAILNALPSWNKINEVVLRQQSIICSNNKLVAKNFGSLYVLLPVDGTKLVVSSMSDIHKQQWEGISGFGEKFGGLGATDIAKGVSSLVSAIFGKHAASTSKTSSNFIESLKKITLPMILAVIAAPETNSNAKSSFKHYANMMKHYNMPTLFETLNVAMSPDNAGFSLKSISDTIPDDREIWFNSKFAAIKMQEHPNKDLIDFCKKLNLTISKFIL